MLFFICTGFASDRIDHVNVHSTNMAKARFGCENINFSYDYLAKLHSAFNFLK